MHSDGQTVEPTTEGSDLVRVRPPLERVAESSFQNALKAVHKAGPHVTHLIASIATKTTIINGSITSVAIGPAHASVSTAFMR